MTILKGFSGKIIAAFLTVSIIPLILINIIFYQINAKSSYNKLTETIASTNRQIIQQIESRLSQMDNVANTLQYYMYTFPDREGSLSTEDLDSFYTLRSNINTLNSTYAFKHICVFLKDSVRFSKEGLMFYPLSRLDDFQISEDLLKNSRSDSYSIWNYTKGLQFPFMLDQTYDPVDTVNCIRVQKNSGELEYAFMISITADEFGELLSSAYDNPEINGFLFDNNGTIITCGKDAEIPEDMISKCMEQARKTQQIIETEHDLYYINKLSNNWYYIAQVSEHYITSSKYFYIRILMIVLALIIPLTAVTVILITKSLTKRILILSESLEKINVEQDVFHGQMVEYINDKPEKDYDEVDRLAVTYNRMLTALDENIARITELKTQETSLKYRLLQSLINPHFLYNILDSIMACNRLGKTETANSMIMNLTKFYRMTLQKSNELITIRDELEITRLYLELESMFRGGCILWDIEKDDEIENFMICKFTLQPFIENSIRHGMQATEKPLHIHIEIRYNDETIQIFISDDGHGIQPDKLAELQESLRAGHLDTGKHFGICNVNARISSELFGYGFVEIDSTEGEGTFVKIEFQQILPDTE